ncbi:MAG: hypothetical protein WD875_08235 [Pirellulales bacterium]
MNQSIDVRRLSKSVFAALAAALSFVSACGGTQAIAVEPAAKSADSPVDAVNAPPSDEAMCRWIEALASPSSADRGEAQSELSRAGNAALPHVAAAARSPNPEVRLRSVEILRRHAAGDDAALAAAAQASLDELASASQTPVARAAQTALAVNAQQRLADEARKNESQMIVRGRGIVMIRPAIIARAAVARRVAVGRSVSVTVINGKRTIVAEEGGERVEISDGGDDGIKMTITKTIDGKEKKESFAAQDAKQLKEKHPEAYKEYAKHADDGGGAAVRQRLVEILGEKAVDGANGEKKEAKPRSEKLPADAAPAARLPRQLPPPNHVDVPIVPSVPKRR